MRGTLISGTGRGPDPLRHVLQVGHGPAPHLAPGRRRRPLDRHGPPPRGGPGQDRRLRVRPPLPVRLPDPRRLAADHPDRRGRLQPGRGRRGDRRDRLQADPGLLHGQPDRLHLPGLQHGQPDRDLRLAPLHPDARPGQGRPLPLRRDRHPRHAQEGHPGDGRPDQDDARHGRLLPGLRLLGHRDPALRRLLLQVPGHHGDGQRRPDLARRRRPCSRPS